MIFILSDKPITRSAKLLSNLPEHPIVEEYHQRSWNQQEDEHPEHENDHPCDPRLVE